ncbi:hypothetical protein HDU80_011693 [Chytriomyces hyalinus]|nr:hypothetical protein HDU80_011693 [Chytriomyces hyalinus]
MLFHTQLPSSDCVAAVARTHSNAPENASNSSNINSNNHALEPRFDCFSGFDSDSIEALALSITQEPTPWTQTFQQTCYFNTPQAAANLCLSSTQTPSTSPDIGPSSQVSHDASSKKSRKSVSNRQPSASVERDPLTNSRPRKYVCIHVGCGMEFLSSGHLVRHHRIHTQERPFKCSIPTCEMTFARSDTAIKHSRGHVKKLQIAGHEIPPELLSPRVTFSAAALTPGTSTESFQQRQYRRRKPATLPPQWKPEQQIAVSSQLSVSEHSPQSCTDEPCPMPNTFPRQDTSFQPTFSDKTPIRGFPTIGSSSAHAFTPDNLNMSDLQLDPIHLLQLSDSAAMWNYYNSCPAPPVHLLQNLPQNMAMGYREHPNLSLPQQHLQFQPQYLPNGFIGDSHLAVTHYNPQFLHPTSYMFQSFEPAPKSTVQPHTRYQEPITQESQSSPDVLRGCDIDALSPENVADYWNDSGVLANACALFEAPAHTLPQQRVQGVQGFVPNLEHCTSSDLSLSDNFPMLNETDLGILLEGSDFLLDQGHSLLSDILL